MAATKPEVVSAELSSYLTLRDIFKLMVNTSYSRSIEVCQHFAETAREALTDVLVSRHTNRCTRRVYMRGHVT